MTTKSHKTLTGNQLHEPKGADAASANTLYVADGAGSGAWSKLTASNLTTTGNPFGAQLLHVREEQTSGTAGGNFYAGAWYARTLNTTKTNEITSSSLAANQVTLPSGTYYIEANAPTYNVGSHQLRLYNTTDASSVLIGPNEYSASNSTAAFLKGRFTIAGTKVFELQHRCAVNSATVGMGQPTSWGTEIYSEVRIWKIL